MDVKPPVSVPQLRCSGCEKNQPVDGCEINSNQKYTGRCTIRHAPESTVSVPTESRPTPIDGKFGFKDGKIVNLVSGQEIPEDEPLFLLRARDHHAIEALHQYGLLCQEDCNDLHMAGIQQVPERMKQPGITRHLKLSAGLPVGESTREKVQYEPLHRIVLGCRPQYVLNHCPDVTFSLASDGLTLIIRRRVNAETAKPPGLGESREPIPSRKEE